MMSVVAVLTVLAVTDPPVHMEVFAAGSQTTTTGPSAHFTGVVEVTPLLSASPHLHASSAAVSFQPGARSAWHTHPAGQMLLVTKGLGWVQEWGGTKHALRVGDVVWTPPGVKHWHGATASDGLTHVAIQEAVKGSAVTWLEQVSDAQYEAP